MQAMVHSASVGPIFIWEWSVVAHMLSVIEPVNFRFPGAADTLTNDATIIRRLRNRGLITASVNYSPGVMRWAVEVPAFMIHTPPAAPVSGRPSVFVVAPGTAMVIWYLGVA